MRFLLAHGYNEAVAVRRPVRVQALPTVWKNRPQGASIPGNNEDLAGLTGAGPSEEYLLALRPPPRGKSLERRTGQSQALRPIRATPPQGTVRPVRINN